VASAEIGPIWRSVRRHRAFVPLVVEVALGFFIIGNLMMSIRWYAGHFTPTSGHREADVLEVVTRGPAAPEAAVEERRRAELAALAALPGARAVAAVSSSSVDDRWETPDVFWSDGAAGVDVGPSRCPGVTRSSAGVVVGWAVGAGPGVATALDLRIVEGGFVEAPFGEGDASAGGGVIITRCLRDALFGGAPGLGRTLRSNRRPPARIVGVVEDVRLHVAVLYQTIVTAIYPGGFGDARVDRYVVRAEEGRAEALRQAAGPALAAIGKARATGPDRLVQARLFSDPGTRSASIARGTVYLLLYVGVLLGVLAIMGNFAVAAFLVGDRRRIIGVRRALGANRADIVRYLLIENLLPTQLGNLLGLLVVLASLPAAKLRFAGIRFDIIDALATALLLSTGGILAKLFPALRAMRIPPSVVTRSL
jgi:putative ABC transport system permease protein